ncbi:hypothetical protein, partial [Deinococcus marmoris]|uniref:hypothetical protein n=1 Tax=Deinococcus marmoris TaxID=249408 RepID=UPI0039F11216
MSEPLNKRETNTEITQETSQEISQKREAAAPPALLDHLQKEFICQLPTEQPADAALPIGSNTDLPQNSLVPPTAQGRLDDHLTSSEKVPAGGAAVRSETEIYLRRKLSHK